MQTADNVARWFLSRNLVRAEPDLISNLKLQKLLYYAQGLHLAMHNKPLFLDHIVAWQYGPVVESVYRIYAGYGFNPIVKFEKPVENFHGNERDILQFTLREFGQFSPWKLSDMVREESPWVDTDSNRVISRAKIKWFFKKHYIDYSN